jgi:uncharacterized protein
MALLFEWDEKKAEANLRKHKVSFEEAKTIFADEHSITIPDTRHSDSEDRFVDIGMSVKQHLLAAVYTERDGRIRLISSRAATKSERRYYEGHR